MKLKRLTASLLSLCMLFAAFGTTLASTAFAVDENGGAELIITNTPSTTGISITGKSFAVYEIFTATINDDGTEYDDDDLTVLSYNDSFDYTLTAAFAPFFEAQLGAGFDYPNVTEYDNDPTDPDYLIALGVATNAAMDFIHLYDNNLNLDGTLADDADDDALGSMQDLVEMLREYVLTTSNGITAVATTNTATDPSSSGGSQSVHTTNANLLGYYLVLDSADTLEAGSDAITGMLYNMPSRASDGTLTNDRTVSLKASAPTITKEIWHNDLNAWDTVGDYQMGDTVTFRIMATIPSNLTGYTDDTYTYIIEDTMSDGLTLVPESVTIYKDAALTDAVEGNLHDELDSNYYDTSYYNEGETTIFTYSFDMVSILANFPTLGAFYISYEAIVDDSAKVSTEGYETNTVELIYSTNPYDETATDSVKDTVYSYTFDLEVQKTTGDGVTPLAGAEFSLYEANAISEGTDAILYFDLVPDENANAIYYVTSSPIATSTTTIITNDAGFFTIVGLDDATNYKLVETEAPDGYNVADPLNFIIEATYSNDNYGVPQVSVLYAGGQIDNTGNNLSTTIINTSSALLPSTGGAGTTLFTYGGIILMLCAGAVLVIKRKKS